MLETKVIKELTDLTNLKWTKTRNSSGTAGSFLKAYSELGGKRLYYKLSNYDDINGVTGIESINEIIVDRLLTILGIEHLHYQLINAKIKVNEKELITYLCVSENFRNVDEDKMPIDNYYDVEHNDGESKIDFCINRGFEKFIYNMFVVDFIILNRDRHGLNIEILRDRKKHTIRPAILFDHGLSLLFNCENDEEIKNYDIFEEKKVNSYLGSSSTLENLNLIPVDKLPKLKPLKESDKKIIFSDLDGVISELMIQKIWEMIFNRYKYYEDFCDKRIK